MDYGSNIANAYGVQQNGGAYRPRTYFKNNLTTLTINFEKICFRGTPLSCILDEKLNFQNKMAL